MLDPLDPVIHAPVRLRIMVTLAALGPGDDLSFSRLQSLHQLTAGNLITHLRKLEDAGYVLTRKQGRATSARLTEEGRVAFTTYRRTLRSMLG
ncbi:transcriptional regulator [Propioniciclava soli]|uniref:transcriptional regulator n=1 Tax=Propioniciclava soli TaxID=2775081 RepID=UPI001E46712B